MTWSRLDPAIQAVAERVLTRKQLDVWKLMLAGNSQYRISIMLLVTRRTVRTHLHDGHVKLLANGVRLRDDGTYYLEKEAA